MNNKRSVQAQAAALIKKDLQAKYPLIKFAVKSDMYSVRACWTDGPTAHDVEQVMNPYTNGTFDGMTDCFNYAKSAKPVSVNYVFADREYSAAARDNMRADLAKKWGIVNTEDEDALPDRPYGIWTMGQFIDHELQNVDLCHDAAFVIKPSAPVCLTPSQPAPAVDPLIDSITRTLTATTDPLDEVSPFTAKDVDHLLDLFMAGLVQLNNPPAEIKFVVGK